MCTTSAATTGINESRMLDKVLLEQAIYPVFQPIFSLDTGKPAAFEALSRISDDSCTLRIDQLFELAGTSQRLWELETLCRSKALAKAFTLPGHCKLFINVDANIIHDPALRAGFTRERMRQCGLAFEDVVFEITERSAINDMQMFNEAVHHYQSQNFEIAIDDFGSGFSGMNRVCAVHPNYLKIDYELVHNVGSEALKRSAVTSIVGFCKEANITTIAEGIETREELATLIELGVDYGQGFLLARPAEEFDARPCDEILLMKDWLTSNIRMRAAFDNIASLVEKGLSVDPDVPAIYVFDEMRQNPDISEAVVVDEYQRVQGVMPRASVLELFSGRFGYEIGKKHTVSEVMHRDFLSVDSQMTLDDVATRAMARGPQSVYDAIVVTDNQEYLGTVSVKNLLLEATNAQVKRAQYASPLTGLPGNWEVQDVIARALESDSAFSLAYFDIDNFKAYNDAYGFAHGDTMIQALADALCTYVPTNGFVGHIGGDDFVLITGDYEAAELCQRIIDMFTQTTAGLYTSEDRERGYIISKNRSGFVENFPLATLSVAVITNQKKAFKESAELSEAVAKAKKQAKIASGNAIVIV